MEHEPVADLPPYVPTRLANEFVYCPRFFHLAWSAGEQGENDFTAEGKWEHRRVDIETGRLDIGGGEARATSVLVSSDRLGAIAKVDIVRSSDGTVVPVELKRGQLRDAEHPVWEPERVQIALAAMILRDNGFEVPHAEVRFTGSWSDPGVTPGWRTPIVRRAEACLGRSPDASSSSSRVPATRG